MYPFLKRWDAKQTASIVSWFMRSGPKLERVEGVDDEAPRDVFVPFRIVRGAATFRPLAKV